ncbi:MAG: class I SAM-dependent methyltransferase [Candidatus Saganbacteria bacterium]|nr:class I SAM-dependent methyltransferase [Candidatus Saganbacteria bacterium]
MNFTCLNCGGSVQKITDLFFCPKCRTEYPVKNGVICLSSGISYWHIIPKEKMSAFLEEAKKIGWKQAILSNKDEKIRAQYLWTDCPSRADSTFYLPLTKDSIVLDLGSGWGSYTFALSPRVDQVVAADSCLESLEFISLRAQQDNISNITPVHIEPLDLGKIPFADGQFDSVIMNGVLEWVGSYLKNGDPLKMQTKCLKEINRVLKKDGHILIGIENRFGLRYFTGTADDHLKHYSEKPVKYTTLLPRLVANIISKRKLGVAYRTYTHSFWGYGRMFRKAGFKDIVFFYPRDDYRSASTAILPAESGETANNIGKRIVNKYVLALVKFFKLEKALCDSYFIAAKK